MFVVLLPHAMHLYLEPAEQSVHHLPVLDLQHCFGENVSHLVLSLATVSGDVALSNLVVDETVSQVNVPESFCVNGCLSQLHCCFVVNIDREWFRHFHFDFVKEVLEG